MAKRQRIIADGKTDGADWIIPSSLLTLSNPLDAFSLGLERKEEPVHFCNTAIIYGVPIPIPGVERRVKTWFYLKDNVGPRANIITAVKRYGSSGFFPVGKKIFGLQKMPDIYTVASARPYNYKGSMFPLKDEGRAYNVVDKYIKGSDGWKAQLVPVGSVYQH